MNPANLPFLLDALERRGQFSASKTTDGFRAVVEVSTGYHDAVRLAEILGAHEPRKHGTRWRIRVRGAAAEALLGELMPHFSDRSAVLARRVLAKVAEARAARLGPSSWRQRSVTGELHP